MDFVPVLVFPENFHTISKQSHSHPVQTMSRPSHNSGINNEGWQAHYLSLSAPNVSGKYKLYQTQKTCNLENSIWLSLADQSGQLGASLAAVKEFQTAPVTSTTSKHPQLAASHFHQPRRLLPGARGSCDEMQHCLWLPEQWLKPAAIAEYASITETAVWQKKEKVEEVKSGWLFFAAMKNYIILCEGNDHLISVAVACNLLQGVSMFTLVLMSKLILWQLFSK